MGEHGITKYFRSSANLKKKVNPYLEELVSKHKLLDLPSHSQKGNLSSILSTVSCYSSRHSNLSKRKLVASRQKEFSKKKKNYQQLTLYLGQVQEYECPTCRMFYCKGSTSDEKLHAKYHRDFHEPTLSFSTWRPHQVLYESDDRESVIVVMDHQLTATERTRLAGILNLVDTFLSYSSVGFDCMLRDDERVYLYVQRRKVIGVLRAERVKEAFRLISCQKVTDTPNKKVSRVSDDDQVDSDLNDVSARMNTEGSVISVVSIPEKANLGISRVWVCEPARRKGIAKKLVDTCRSTFFFGCIVPKSSCAMSQPTADGLQFGYHYFGTLEFLVYGCQ